MRYFINTNNGYINSISTVNLDGRGNATAEQYEEVKALYGNKPSVPEGYDYRLKDTLEWELYELPIIPPTEEVEELTYDEILVALADAEYELCLWELGIHDDFMEE